MLEIKLTDLISKDVLQRIQTGFSDYAGIATLTTDEEGTPITQGSGFTPFCMNLIRKSELGCTRCMQCDKEGAMISLESGTPAVYYCHAGLVDFAAPIMVNGEFIGCFIGGQILTAPPDMDEARKMARELGIDEDAYLTELSGIPAVPYEQVEKTAHFLFEIAGILSEMAYSNYLALNQSQQLERTTRSHNHFIVDMNNSMKSHVQDWISAACDLKKFPLPRRASVLLSRLMSKGSEFISAIDETVEFAQMTNGEIQLKETEYNPKSLLNEIMDNLQDMAAGKKLFLKLTMASDFPETLLGDTGRIRQIITKLVQNSIHYTEQGGIWVQASIKKHSYASNIVIAISDTGVGLPPEALVRIRSYLQGDALYDAGDSIGLTVIRTLLRKMYAKLDVTSAPGDGTTFTLTIPQLALPEAAAV